MTAQPTYNSTRKALRALLRRLTAAALANGDVQAIQEEIEHAKALLARLKKLENYKPRQLFRRMRYEALRNGVEWLLEYADIEPYIGKPCSTCGHVASSEEPQVSLARIDKAKPYTKDNVRPSCPNCNRVVNRRSNG